MKMKYERKNLRRSLKVVMAIIVVMALAFVVYFPGRQASIALTLATGIGISSLQDRVDQMEDKAIKGKVFTEDDKRFMRNLYTCFAKGGRLTVVLRQSSQMMRRYLSLSGEDLRTEPRIFIKSEPVRQQMQLLRKQILQNLNESSALKDSYLSDTFHMGDPKFFDSFVGLYFGRIVATPDRSKDGTLRIRWRFECPWEWPSYASLFKKYGEHHAQCFPLPNARSIIFGSRYCLRIDDGLGGHLATLGLAKPFLVYSEWVENVDKKE